MLLIVTESVKPNNLLMKSDMVSVLINDVDSQIELSMILI